MTFRRGELTYENTFKRDEASTPRTIDLTIVRSRWEEDFPPRSGRPRLGIYSVRGGTLTFCFAAPGDKRPTEFKSERGSGWLLTVYERIEDRGAGIEDDVRGRDEVPTHASLRHLVSDVRSVRDSLWEDLAELQAEYHNLRKGGVGPSDPRERSLRNRLDRMKSVYNKNLDVLKGLQLVLDRKQAQFGMDGMVLP